jgi:histidinol-phosphate/aromatic aminotransferase/cobyric acid decarboxylase-like protein/adenosyl cobinamide kinase/adenosyl cobinamide phosphate guanylyltransferase
MGVVLVTGGTRSGKSAVAERLVADVADVAYLATASATDREMTARIGAHRARRPAGWTTIEVGADPVAALAQAGERVALLDGLGVWIAAALHRAGVFDERARLDAAADGIRVLVDELVAAAQARATLTVVVVEEAGTAPVAADAATRRWVDLVGEAAQRIAAVADRALLVVAGRAVELLAPPAMPPAGALEPAAALGHVARPLHGDRMVPPGHEDFAVNVIGGGPPEWLARALREALEAGTGRYPDEREAVAAVAARHRRTEDAVLALNGVAEAFWLLAAVSRPRRAVVITPAFTEARTALRGRGSEPELVRRHEADGFALDPGAVPADADLVVIANPCNPTGTLHPADAVAALARPGRTVVVDEAFMDLVPGEPETLTGRPDLPGLVVLRSLTKSLGVPGIRAGYLLADPELVTRLAGARQPWSVNALALAALRAWAAREAPAAEIAEYVAGARERLTASLRALPGVTVHPGAANFLLVHVPDGARVLAGLRERRIAVRPTTDLGLDVDHLRVAVRDDAANERLVTGLAAVLTKELAP